MCDLYSASHAALIVSGNANLIKDINVSRPSEKKIGHYMAKASGSSLDTKKEVLKKVTDVL